MKSCFIIMPISEADPYPVGHFKRVYDYIIKPACEKAGFSPVRADDIQNTNYIALDIIRRIVECDVAICDLSSRNPNVLYELGIRQAFNLPVVLLKDKATPRIFDIQGFRDIEYDDSMRIDNVNQTIEALSNTITNTVESQNVEVNSLIALLKIQPAQISERVEISNDTELILNSLENLRVRMTELEKSVTAKPRSGILNPSAQEPLSREQLEDAPIGTVVFHPKFGKGTINAMEGNENNRIVTVDFEKEGLKKIVVNYAKLYS